MTQAIEKLHEGQHPSSIKYKVGVIIGSRWVEFAIMVLLFIDLVLVKIEVGVNNHILCIEGVLLSIPQEKILELRDVEGPADTNFQILQPAQNMSLISRRKSLLSQRKLVSVQSSLAGEGSGRSVSEEQEAELAVARSTGEHVHHPAGSLICEDKHGHTAHHLEHTCHMWSTIILCIFMLELMIKIWVSPRVFFGNIYHVLDFVIVSLSLAFDIASYLLQWMGLEIVSVILIICRLWRILRIVHALFELVHTQVEHVDELEHEVAETQAELDKLQEKLKRLEKRSA